MKKLLGWSILVVSILFLSSCATTQVSYEQSIFGFDRGGEVNIVLSRAVPQLTIVVNDKIVLDARTFGTRRVDIKGLPRGEHSIKMFANSWQLKENFRYEGTVEVRAGRSQPVMVEVPQYSTMYWVYVIGLAVVSALPSVVVVY